MPVPLILCRLKEDHSVTQMIGETALFHFPDWERVPEEEPEAKPEDKPEPKAETTTSKAATSKTGKAAAASAENKE